MILGRKRTRKESRPIDTPTNAFEHYCAQAGRRFRTENPGMSTPEINRALTKQWEGMSKQEREPYVITHQNEGGNSKNSNKRIKVSEFDESKPPHHNEEGDSFKDHGSFGGDGVEFQQNKGNSSFSKKDSRNSVNKGKGDSKSNDYFQNKNHSPGQDGPIRFNLPENKQPMYNQPSPNPLPVRKDVNFMGGMGSYQDVTQGSSGMDQASFYNNMNRNQIFSPMPMMQNRSPGISPNMVPMYSPMMMKNDNFRDYSNRSFVNVQRNPTVMGQCSSTPVNKNDAQYTDFYQVSASPSWYTPMRTGMTRFNPGFSPNHQGDTSTIFGPSPNIMPNSLGKTPINQFAGNKQVFATPKPVNQGNTQGNEGSKNAKTEDNHLFDLNPF